MGDRTLVRLSSSSPDQPLNWKTRNPRLWPTRARGRRPNQTSSARTITRAPAVYRRGMTLREAGVGSTNEEPTRPRCAEDRQADLQRDQRKKGLRAIDGGYAKEEIIYVA